MPARREDISFDLQTQWQDHFHMRDQTWKVVQYSILFFLGVVGLEIKGIELSVIVIGYLGALCTSLFGVIIALHHRRREKEKFEIIKIYEERLELDVLIAPVLATAHRGLTGQMNTTTYIVAIQAGIFVVSLALLLNRITV